MRSRVSRICLVFCVATAFVSLVAIGCNQKTSPAAPQTANVIGQWNGLHIWPLAQGSEMFAPDTSVINLKISVDSSYSMVRYKITHGSAPEDVSNADSATEAGKVSVSGDIATLNSMHCTQFNWDTYAVVDTPCSAPKTIPIAIQNGVWTVSLKNADNPDTVTYTMQKQ